MTRRIVLTYKMADSLFSSISGLLLLVIAVLAVTGNAFAETYEIPTKSSSKIRLSNVHLKRTDLATDFLPDVAKRSENCQFPSSCPSFGHSRYSHETDCRLYYECSNGRKCLLSCFQGYVFNPMIGTCDLPKNVPNCRY